MPGGCVVDVSIGARSVLCLAFQSRELPLVRAHCERLPTKIGCCPLRYRRRLINPSCPWTMRWMRAKRHRGSGLFACAATSPDEAYIIAESLFPVRPCIFPPVSPRPAFPSEIGAAGVHHPDQGPKSEIGSTDRYSTQRSLARSSPAERPVTWLRCECLLNSGR